MIRRAILAGLLFALPPLLPAQAALRLCNRTSYILYAATSTFSNNVSTTQGWTRLISGDCQVALNMPLGGLSLRVYARSALAHSGPQRAWGGNAKLCVRDGNFTLRQPVSMPYCSANFFAAPFAAINTQGKNDWTMNFDEQPALASLTAGQLAGVRRLLKDNGFAVGPINGPPDKPTGKALSEFRARMHFAPNNAGNDALFAALETEAMKTAAPAGYTVCNDSAQDLLIAIGDAQGKSVSRGWWPIAPAACARTITTPLAVDAVYLLAQRQNGDPVAGGADKFCVTPQEFEIQGRANCVSRGYAEAGFARTVTKNLGGYVAHIGAMGLLPPLPHKPVPTGPLPAGSLQAGISK